MVPVENVTDEIDPYPGTPLSLREGRVHHLHGPGGSGKTTACLNWAARVTAAGKVAYWIDTTNGFSAAKFTSFLGAPALLQYMRAKTPEALEHGITSVVRSWPRTRPGLLVVDTVTGCLAASGDDPFERGRALDAVKGLVASLDLLASTSGMAVVVTNTVGFKPSAGELRPTAEAAVSRFDVVDISLRPGPGVPWRAPLVASCGGASREYRVGPRGIEFLPAGAGGGG